MKPCCLDCAKRHLKKNRAVATCDRCGFLLMAYAESRDLEEALKNLQAWGGEFDTTRLGHLHVVAKARSSPKRV